MSDTYDITIEQEATFTLEVQWKDADGVAIDMTGYAVYAQGRLYTDATVLGWSISTVDGGIVLVALTGTMTMTISAAVTSALSGGDGVWDLLVVSDTESHRLLAGAYSVTGSVTRI